MDTGRKKQELDLREAIACNGEVLWEKLWRQIEAQAKRADNEKRISASFPEGEYKVRVQPAQGRLLKRAKEIRLRRPTTKGIDVTGSINEHFEFDLRDKKLCLKHKEKAVVIPEAAERVLDQLFRLATKE